MSLWIDVEQVAAVLLADGWHATRAFDLDAYEFVIDGEMIAGAGTGFTFIDDDGGVRVYGPLSAILALHARE